MTAGHGPMGTGRRRAVTALVVLAFSASVLATAAPAAQARSVTTYFNRTIPVTWTDEVGRQYLVTSIVTDLSSGADQLVVLRNDAAGDADATWGTYDNPMPQGADVVGARALDPAPPTEGLRLESIVAIDDAGILTATFVNTACQTPQQLCDRWFTRLQLDGTAVGVATQRLATPTPVAPLPDGSLLTRDPAGVAGWRGPDGTDRGAPDPSPAHIDQATVDHAGRLLVTTSARHVIRKPAGAAADLDLDLSGSCTGSNPTLGVGRSTTDDGFATICAPGDPGVIVQRRDAAGAVQWTSTGPGTSIVGQLRTPTTAVIDSADQVWVGGDGEMVPAYPPVGLVMVQPFTSTGPGAVAYVRESPHFQTYERQSHRITDLRPTGSGTVAMADEFGCCSGNGFDVPANVVTAELLPHPPAAPTCTATSLAVAAVDQDSADITFATCPTQPAAVAPTSYRVTASDAQGATIASTTTLTPATDRRLSAHLDGLTGGHFARFRVTASTSGGDGPASPSIATVLPYPSVRAFVEGQYPLLSAGRNDTIVDQTVTKIVSGTLEPDAFVDALLDGGNAKQHIEPTARLYRAYFERDPDEGGLAYWSNRTVSPGISFGQMSEQFAHSSEFQRRYGSLSNKAFVAKVYENVFGRTADAGGLAFWTKRLDTRRDNRGRVVLQFSESSEGLRRSAPIVQPLATAYLMLGRLPTPTERSAWTALDDFHLDVARIILASAEYAERVAP